MIIVFLTQFCSNFLFSFYHSPYIGIPIETITPTTSLQADIVRQKGSLFKQIPFRRLTNSVIKVKHGLSLIRCGAECNNLDDCVSFNIGNGVCELNNRMVEIADVNGGFFVADEGFKYFQKV